ncbi:MAG: hypothetical protein QGH11_14350, partial [Pirellulaceae bacterium]|nr:hypothetical protein [Pirellulaceae bacterium]
YAVDRMALERAAQVLEGVAVLHRPVGLNMAYAEEDRKAETKSKESSSEKKEGGSKKPAAKAGKKSTPKPDKGSSKD